MSTELERTLFDVYSYINEFRASYGYSPSNREIKTALGINSTSSVHSYLHKLQEKGFVVLSAKNKSRAIALPPLDDSEACLLPAGEKHTYKESDAAEYKVFYSLMLKDENALSFFKMPDDSFAELLIRKGDFLILKKSVSANKKDMCLYKDATGCFLKQSVGSKEYTAYVMPTESLMSADQGVVGVVVCVIRNLIRNDNYSNLANPLE